MVAIVSVVTVSVVCVDGIKVELLLFSVSSLVDVVDDVVEVELVKVEVEVVVVVGVEVEVEVELVEVEVIVVEVVVGKTAATSASHVKLMIAVEAFFVPEPYTK